MHDNSALRAFTWDENRAGVTEKPKGSRNIDGGSLGGPIKKNKLFFFADWEGTFERVSRSVLLFGPDGRLPQRRFQPHAGRADPERQRQPHSWCPPPRAARRRCGKG